MNTHIKKQHIIVILAALLIIGAGFGLYGFVRNYEQTQMLVAAQQKNLATAQQEIKNLATSASSSEATIQKKTNQANNPVTQSLNDNSSIQASDIAPYLNGILQLNCGYVSGSSSLWNISNLGYVALTNFHVIKNAYNDPNPNVKCMLNPDSEVNTGPVFLVLVTPSQNKPFNLTADEAVLPIENVTELTAGGQVSEPASILDYKISSLPKCSSKMEIGSPVVTVGFPAFAMQTENTNIGVPATKSSLITSNGTISGYDDSSTPPNGNLPYMNYYVSAKIDSGNSGGIAFSKDASGLCVLGVPTWISTGNYENEGVVQNINNVMYQQ